MSLRSLYGRPGKPRGEGDEPLLGTVVQVSLEPPSSLIGGGDQTRSRCADSLYQPLAFGGQGRDREGGQGQGGNEQLRTEQRPAD
jgi:hypothetical protein